MRLGYVGYDVFFGLDMQPQVQIAQQPFYQQLRRQGVTVKFLLHDLLPIQMPEFFPPGNKEGFTRWLRSITATDGVICVSRTVSEELREWVEQNCPDRERPLQIAWSHNGADIDNSAPSKGMPDDAQEVLARLAARPSFLMVGTLEPRKGHADILDAFDVLWREGEDINLVIVGKMGWKIEDLAERIRSHPELNQRLFWLAGISDEYLDAIYSSCACLVSASYGEGFGLPLIEAARKGLPLILRDIPIFREIAGHNATFFPGRSNPRETAHTVSCWISNHKNMMVKQSTRIPSMLWRESVNNLNHLLGISAGGGWL